MWIKSEKSRKNQIKTDPFSKSFRKMLDNSTIHCYHNLIERDRSTLEKYIFLLVFFFVYKYIFLLDLCGLLFILLML